MTPHPEEIATLLALPPAVRQALARCEGPGWLWMGEWTDRSATDVTGSSAPVTHPATTTAQTAMLTGPYLRGLEALGCGWAWLPADSAAIVDLAAHLGGVTRRRALEWIAFKGYDDEDKPFRLAALRLLAEVAAATP